MPLCFKKKWYKLLLYLKIFDIQSCKTNANFAIKNGFGKSLEWSLSTYPIHGYLKSKEPDVQFYCYIIIIFIHINGQFVALKCFR